MDVNMTFAGCAWAIGKLMDLNITVAHAMKKILMWLTNRRMLEPKKPWKNISTILNGLAKDNIEILIVNSWNLFFLF